MNFLIRWWLRRDTKRNVAELSNFVNLLRSGSDQDMADLLIIVTDTRHTIAAKGFDVMKPFELWVLNPTGKHFLVGMLQKLQKMPAHPLRSAYLVWVHTCKGSSTAAAKPQLEALWSNLHRGLPYLENAKSKLIANGAARDINITGADQIPRF